MVFHKQLFKSLGKWPKMQTLGDWQGGCEAYWNVTVIYMFHSEYSDFAQTSLSLKQKVIWLQKATVIHATNLSSPTWLCSSISNQGSHIVKRSDYIGRLSCSLSWSIPAKHCKGLISIPTNSQRPCNATTVGSDRKHFLLKALIHHSWMKKDGSYA